MAKKKPLSLGELTKALRNEIDQLRADLASSGREALLELEGAEVEVRFVVKNDVKAGLKFLPVELGSSYAEEQTHALKLRLKPIAEEGPIAVAE